jgi:hypothetical protein
MRGGRRVNHLCGGTVDGVRHLFEMTLEMMVLQCLGGGPVDALTIADADQDELALTLKFMIARRQIYRKAGWMSLYWHRHMIPSAPIVMAQAKVALAAAG